MSSPTRTLMVMRHAKAYWDRNGSDVQRPLAQRGARDASVTGATLAALPIDVVLLSPAVRAQQTWSNVERGGARARTVRTIEALYHGWTPQIITTLRGLPAAARRVLIVGHEPLVTDLVLTLSVTSPLSTRLTNQFPTGAVATLTHGVDWDELDAGLAQLVSFEVPRG